jgi:hypothetical protein
MPAVEWQFRPLETTFNGQLVRSDIALRQILQARKRVYPHRLISVDSLLMVKALFGNI